MQQIILPIYRTYNVLVGGVLVVTKQQYLAVNGFSNLYWGWGGEDDDMQRRVTIGGKMTIRRPPFKYAKLGFQIDVQP